MTPIVVMTGGGLRGAVAAARYAEECDLTLVHMNYGQESATAEAAAVQRLARSFSSARAVLLNLPHVIQLQDAFPSPHHLSQRTSVSKDDSHATLRGSWGGLPAVLLAIGVQCVMSDRASTLVVGLGSRSDASHIGLPGPDGKLDFRREFLHAFNIMVETACPRRPAIRVEAPLMDLSDSEVVKLAYRFQVPCEHTWSCRSSRATPCGRCKPCKRRSEAFLGAAYADPLTDFADARTVPRRA